jgi:hypothetical protein
MWKTLTTARIYLAVLPRKLRRELLRAVQAISKSGEPVAHTAVFSVALGHSFPPAFSAREFPGLLFCHIVRTASGEKVVTYWRDQDHLRAYLGVFQTRAGVSSAPDFDGSAIEVKYPEKPWWKVWTKLGDYSPKEWIVGFLAILGAFLGLRDYFSVFFAPPEVAIAYADDAHIDTVEGAQFLVPIAVRSEVRFVPTYVSFVQHEIQIPGDSAKPVSLSREILPNLAAGVSESVNISGAAPVFSRHQRSPDIYHFSIKAQAKAGLARWRRALIAPPHDLWVWPSAPLAAPPTIVGAAGNICRLDGLAYISKPKPQGLDAEFIVVAPLADLDRMNVTAAANTEPRILQMDTASVRTIKVEFRTPPFDKFQEYVYQIFLYAPRAVTKATCEKLSSGIVVHLEQPIP